MSGGKNKQPHCFGYTIIEVMIFLAVSGMMFLLASIFISGKQAVAEYHQGMNDINSQIHTVINDVANGYYPSNQDFTCSVVGNNAPSFTHLASGQQESGSNADCIFMGKVIQFGVQGSNGTGYNIFSVAGRRFGVGSADTSPLTFTEAKPAAADNTAAGVNLTVANKLAWGLRATGMYKVTYSAGAPSYQPIGAIGFFGNFGNVSGGVLQSGAQTVTVADVPNSRLDKTEADTAGYISGITSATGADSAILLCFQDGRGRTGSITIGGQNGQQLQTTVKFGAGAPC